MTRWLALVTLAALARPALAAGEPADFAQAPLNAHQLGQKDAVKA